MLAKHHRLRASNDFTNTVRNGRRVGTRTLVVHHLAASQDPRSDQQHRQVAGDGSPIGGETTAVARIGFIVSRAVGGSVTRTRVARRLRHVARTHMDQIPAGSLTVVRALPAAAAASSAQLDSDLTFALGKLGIGGGV